MTQVSKDGSSNEILTQDSLYNGNINRNRYNGMNINYNNNNSSNNSNSNNNSNDIKSHRRTRSRRTHSARVNKNVIARQAIGINHMAPISSESSISIVNSPRRSIIHSNSHGNEISGAVLSDKISITASTNLLISKEFQTAQAQITSILARLAQHVKGNDNLKGDKHSVIINWDYN